MKMVVLCVGKIKEKFYKDAVAEYMKRLTRYVKINIIEVADEKTPDNASITEENNIKKKESDRILSHIKDDSYVIALAIEGEQLDSIKLSKKIEQLELASKKNVYLVIGGSLGLSKEVLERADMKLSFSKMTFPHQLMRVILLEQIYRSYRIMKNEPYHK